MKKFIAIYHTTPEEVAKNMSLSTEEREKGMAAWMSWKEKANKHIVDFGAPLLPGEIGNETQKWKVNTSTFNGYSILQANSIEELKEVLVDHPHLTANVGSTLELREFMPI